MQCYHPLMVPLKENGKLKENAEGKHYVLVPCGKCLACKKERSKAWAIRLMLESLSWDDCCFITLTYDPENVPFTDVMLNSQKLPYTLFKRDLQLFFKRLRRDLDYDGRKIKYYAVGEYGDHTFRPHYHAIIFGMSSLDRSLFEENWNKGIVDIGDVTIKSCNYVAGYVQKKLYGEVADDVYGLREWPFSVMSKGLGKAYIEENYEDLYKNGFVLFQSRKIALSRYFWETMKKDNLIPYSSLDIGLRRRKSMHFAKDKLEREYNKLGLFNEKEQAEFEERRLQARKKVYETLEKFNSRGVL